MAVLLAASVATLAAGLAWLLTWAFDLAPAGAAALAAAFALLAASIPTLALVMARLQTTTPEPAPAPAAPPVHDSGTGAYRFDVFLQLAGREWSRARRYGTGAAMLVVDLDRATALHELHGHAAAVALLDELSCLTAPTLRGADLVTRLAPFQLGVFLAQADPTGALDVAERIRERAEALTLTWPAPGNSGDASGTGPLSLRSMVSVGVAALRPAHLSLQDVLQDALDAVNAAHLAGGNCVRAAPVDTVQAMPFGPGHDNLRARPQP